jgi:hypothetical protein
MEPIWFHLFSSYCNYPIIDTLLYLHYLPYQLPLWRNEKWNRYGSGTFCPTVRTFWQAVQSRASRRLLRRLRLRLRRLRLRLRLRRLRRLRRRRRRQRPTREREALHTHSGAQQARKKKGQR